MHVYKLYKEAILSKMTISNLRNYFSHGYKFLNVFLTEMKT